MDWKTLYHQSNPPSLDDIGDYVDRPRWKTINYFLSSTYQTEPEFSYSKCSMQPGWNVKYKKSGKSLCTLYPMEGYFIALVVIGSKETEEAEMILPSCSEYTQALYQNSTFSCGGRWLMIHVTEDKILDDVLKLIQTRLKRKRST